MKLSFFLTLFLGLFWVLSILAVHLLWPEADNRPRGVARTLNPFRRLAFLFGLVWMAMSDRLRGRRLAINAVLTPHETSRGTQSLLSDAAVAFFNALVKTGSDDRHITPVTGATDIPRGILLQDSVSAGDVNSVPKQVALLGVYPETLPAVAAGAIAVNAEIVADLATPGYVKQLPGTTGTYVVLGRSRFAVAAAGDPVSIIHCLPRTVSV